MFDQEECQLTPVWHFVAVHEIRNGGRQFAHLLLASATKFCGYIGRDIFRPALGRIEGDNAEGIPAAAYRQLYIGRRMLNRHEPS